MFQQHREVAKPLPSWTGKAVIDAMNASVSHEELDGLPSSVFVAKTFLGAGLVKGFKHLPVATLGADPIVEGGHRGVFLSSDDKDAMAPAADLTKQPGFAPVRLGNLNEVARWFRHATAFGVRSSSRICSRRSSNRLSTVRLGPRSTAPRSPIRSVTL